MTRLDPNQIPGPLCPACLAHLVQATVAGCGLGPAPAAELRAEMMALVQRGLAAGQVPAHIASQFFALVQGRWPGIDPFAAKKKEDFAAARRAAQGLGQLPDTFGDRARAAVLGNAIDHFFLADRDALWQWGRSPDLSLDHLARAEARLRPGGRVVILADNCGEQCFDRLLAEHLARRGCAVDYVVKAGPVQNDLTAADLEAAHEAHGLGRVLGLAPPAVGLDPEGMPAELALILAEADLVIAKGMGHFETLAPAAGVCGGPNQLGWPLLMLFLAKCDTIAASLGLEQGRGVALLTMPD